MTTTMCSSAAVKLKAGAEGKVLTDDQYTTLINQAESFINAETRINYTDTYAGLNAGVQKILEDAASSHAALSAIAYDMSGYTSRLEAQTLLDVNYARLTDALQRLKTKEVTNFIDNA